MIFPGFWIDGMRGDVTIQFAFLDDTELSPESNWKLAYQNGHDDCPCGFVDPFDALKDICGRLLGQRAGEPADLDGVREGETHKISTVDDLARLTLRILRMISPADTLIKGVAQ